MKTKIRIVENSSVWTTRSIKKILNQTLKVFLRWESYDFAEIRVFVKSRKRKIDYIKGGAYPYRPVVYLDLPPYSYSGFQEDLALLFYHELQHTKGLGHRVIGHVDKEAYPNFEFLNNIVLERR